MAMSRVTGQDTAVLPAFRGGQQPRGTIYTRLMANVVHIRLAENLVQDRKRNVHLDTLFPHAREFLQHASGKAVKQDAPALRVSGPIARVLLLEMACEGTQVEGRKPALAERREPL